MYSNNLTFIHLLNRYTIVHMHMNSTYVLYSFVCVQGCLVHFKTRTLWPCIAVIYWCRFSYFTVSILLIFSCLYCLWPRITLCPCRHISVRATCANCVPCFAGTRMLMPTFGCSPSHNTPRLCPVLYPMATFSPPILAPWAFSPPAVRATMRNLLCIYSGKYVNSNGWHPL